MVVVPLICAIFEVPTHVAQQYVVWSTGTYRAVDVQYKQYLHMPETEEQVEVAHQVEPYVRKHVR